MGAFRACRRDTVFLVLLAACVALAFVTDRRLSTWPALVDWSTIAALAGLLVLTHAIDVSGALTIAANRLVATLKTERSLALFLVLASALLATVLTNDVALFALVPLTVKLGARSTAPVARLVVFEAIAVNAGSALTPFGNPQNLFLWRRSGASFVEFVVALAPVVAIAMAVLVLFVLVAFRAKPVTVTKTDAPPPDRRLFVVAALLYVPFLVMTDWHQPVLACALVMALFLGLAPRVVAGIDWLLLVVFALMFVDLRLVAELPVVVRAVAAVDLSDPLRLFAASALASQVISNVPAAILFAESTSDWKTLAWGVSVGGFGVFVGSLANLIALRLLKQRHAWGLFHAYSLPFLAVVAAATGCWIALR